MRTWPAVARELPLRLDRPQEHNELSALSQSAAKVGAVADGEPDDASRGQAASCRTDARSAVIAVATVHGMIGGRQEGGQCMGSRSHARHEQA